jgi:hypothetical protein
MHPPQFDSPQLPHEELSQKISSASRFLQSAMYIVMPMFTLNG